MGESFIIEGVFFSQGLSAIRADNKNHNGFLVGLFKRVILLFLGEEFYGEGLY